MKCKWCGIDESTIKFKFWRKPVVDGEVGEICYEEICDVCCDEILLADSDLTEAPFSATVSHGQV